MRREPFFRLVLLSHWVVHLVQVYELSLGLKILRGEVWRLHLIISVLCVILVRLVLNGERWVVAPHLSDFKILFLNLRILVIGGAGRSLLWFQIVFCHVLLAEMRKWGSLVVNHWSDLVLLIARSLVSESHGDVG